MPLLVCVMSPHRNAGPGRKHAADSEAPPEALARKRRDLLPESIPEGSELLDSLVPHEDRYSGLITLDDLVQLAAMPSFGR